MTDLEMTSLDHAELELSIVHAECKRLKAEVADKVEANIALYRENNLLLARCERLRAELAELSGHCGLFVSSVGKVLRQLEGWDQK